MADDFNSELSDDDINEALAGFETEFSSENLFDSELQGLLGNKAISAVLITQLGAAELLAALCALSDISARCIGSEIGAVAVIRNLDGDGPEAAAREITTVVSGLSVVLAVNRADKISSHLWMDGKEGQEFAPPVMLMSAPEFVEDLLIGSTTVAQLESEGHTIVDSGSIDHGGAYDILAKYMRFGRNSGEAENGKE